MAQRIVRHAALAAAIEKPVCCMTMRHSYAVSLLRHGSDVRNVQERLGHQCIQTTLRYDRYSLPPGVVSPVDRPQFAAVIAPPGATPAASGVPPADAIQQSDEGEPIAAADRPLPPHFSQPTLTLLPLPFADILDGPRQFYARLKARIRHRFGAEKVGYVQSG